MSTIDTRYLFEWTNAPDGRRIMLLPYVNVIRIDRSPVVVSRWPATIPRSTSRPYTEAAGFREVPIMLRGTSGFEDRPSTNRRGKLVTLGGPEAVEELRAFIDEFERARAQTWNAFVRSQRPELVFHALAEGESHYVTKATVVYDRDAFKTTFTYDWTCTIQTEGSYTVQRPGETDAEYFERFEAVDAFNFETREAEREFEAERARVAAALAVANKDSDALKYGVDKRGAVGPGFLDGLDSTTGFFDLCERALREADSGVLTAIREVSRLRAPIDAAKRTLEAVRQLSRDVRSLQRLPRTLVKSAIATAQAIVDEFELFLDAQARFADQAWDDVVQAATYSMAVWSAVATVARVVLFDLRVGLSPEEQGLDRDAQATEDVSVTSSPLTSELAVRSGRLVVGVELGAGQSLLDVAAAYLGDANRWPEIAELSDGWRDPWTLPSGAPAQGGETVIVPVEQNGVLAPRSNVAADDLYGQDFRWSSGDLVVVSGRELSKVRGQARLEQALVLRLETVKGEWALAPSVGVAYRIGEGLDAEAVMLAAVDVKAQCLSDSCVASVPSVTVDQDGDTLTVDADVEPVLGKPFPVSVPYTLEGA